MLTLKEYHRWYKKLYHQVFDACVILLDMDYGYRGGTSKEEFQVLRGMFFQGLFWKNKWIIVTQLNKFYNEREEECASRFLDRLTRGEFDEPFLTSMKCSKGEVQKMLERSSRKLTEHAEHINRNRLVRNKTVVHSPSKTTIAGNAVNWTDLDVLTRLAIEIHTDIGQTLFHKPMDFTVPESYSLKWVVQQIVGAGDVVE